MPIRLQVQSRVLVAPRPGTYRVAARTILEKGPQVHRKTVRAHPILHVRETSNEAGHDDG